MTSSGKRPVFRARGDRRFALVAKHRRIWPVSWLCGTSGLSRSGFHAWLDRATGIRKVDDAKLVTAIEASFKAEDRTYGARRVRRDVLEEGFACGLHRIERRTRANAPRARPKRRGKPKDDGERSVIADNILDRDFQADRPNRSGWPTSPAFGPRKAGPVSRLCWTCILAALSAGP